MENKYTFRLKITHKELEDMALRLLQMENQINSKETKYFTGMTKMGPNYFMEFVIPGAVDNLSTEEKSGV